MITNETYCNKVCNAIDFLTNHPAINIISGEYIKNIWINFSPVCKNGFRQTKYITIYDDDPKFSEITKSNKDYKSGDINISIKYEDYYGYPWKFEKGEYSAELCILYPLYDVTDLSNITYKSVTENVESCHVFELDVYADTYEELMINLAKVLKENFGNYSLFNFYTKKEKLNMKKLPIFIGNKFNPKRKVVHQYILYSRYWKMFLKTEQGKKFKKNFFDE